MLTDIEELKNRAEDYRIIYKAGQCTREEAKLNIMPYINLVNSKSKELAKKYNQRPKLIGFSNYVR
jgi:uncharacterized protein YfaT (DUF1175 family)